MPGHRSLKVQVVRSLTVLVVDDEALLRWSISEVLRRIGHTVLEAATAREARDAFSQTSVELNVALLDYRLPDSNDLRLLEDVRRRFPTCGVVLMTAYATSGLAQAALRRGAYRVLVKPFDMDVIPPLVADAYRSEQ
jgi:DNA-binding NtrC family response regulator